MTTHRCPTCDQPLPEYGGITLDEDRHEIRYNGKRCGTLTGQEFTMFTSLLRAQGRVVSKEMFLNHLYGGMDEPELKIIDVFIYKLRKKLKGLDLDIGTSWGRGYWLQEPGQPTKAPQNGAPAYTVKNLLEE